MTSGPDTLVHRIRRLLMQPERDATDAALLGRFISEKDERAFAALVYRHGPMVLHVCRRVLGNIHDAEDAFQAVFMVLARKAGTVRPRETLTAWLHGVAHRVALKARSARGRRLREIQPMPEPSTDPRSNPLADLSAHELFALVDEEVRRLPEVYRLPVILCCLEGRSQEEAARQLGWTPGSVKGRLERGRARLHDRLVRRGLSLSAVLVAAELSRGVATAAVVRQLAASTIRSALSFAAGQSALGGASAQAAALAGEVVKGIALVKLKIAAALMLTTCLLATGIVQYRAALPPETSAPQVRSSAYSSKAKVARTAPAFLVTNGPPAPRDEANPRFEVSGRVLDPAGKPFQGAKLYVGYSPRRSEPEAVAHQPAYPLRATSGPDGRFGFAFTRSELDERYLDASRPVVVAVADGFGLDWAEIRERDELNLKLNEDFPFDGRILDPDRRPVSGAKIFVREVSRYSADGLKRFLEDSDRSSGSFKSCRGPLAGQPSVVTTDAEGRFRLMGVGRDCLVTVALEGPAIPRTGFTAVNRDAAAVSAKWIRGVPFENVIPVQRSTRGVVRDKLTGAFVSGMKVSNPIGGSTTYTDKDGRYELLALPQMQKYVVMVQPQDGQPYFAAAAQLPNTAGRNALTADFDLVSGIPLRGRVIDEATGKPPKRAVLEYYALFPNAHASALTKLEHLMPASSAAIQPDGSYSLIVLPGPGIVLVAASPRDSYASAWLDDKMLANLFNDGRNHGGGSWIHVAVGGGIQWRRCVDRYNTLSLINPDEKVKSLALDFTVMPARPLRGTVDGPDGKPLLGVRVCGLTSMPDAETLESASFTVEGLNPRRTRELSFCHKEKSLGKVITVRGDETKALSVQLEPCGIVIGRLVDKAGMPVQGEDIWFGCGNTDLQGRAQTDQLGRFRAALMPGLTYQYGLFTSSRLPQKKEHVIAVESGQTENLGDLVLDD